MPLILTFFNTRDLLYSSYGLGLRRPPNQTDCDVTFSRSRDQWKIIKNDRKIIMDVYKGAARGGAEGAQAPPLAIRILMFIS